MLDTTAPVNETERYWQPGYWKRRLVVRGHPEDFILGALPYLVLAILVVWLGSLVPESLTFDQATYIVGIEAVLILLGIGQTIVVWTGGIDLSIGGVLAVTNTIAATQMHTKGSMIGMCILLVAISWIPGLVNGVLIAYGKLQPFIVTLATWFIWDGIAFFVLKVAGGTIDPSLAWLGAASPLGVGTPIWLLGIVFVFALWFPKTRLGLEIRGVGSNHEAAFQTGIRTNRALILAYVLSSVFAVLAGIFLSAQTLSGDPTVGDGYILTSVAALVIGGTSLFGGRGSLVGTIAGALVLAYVYSVTFALQLASQWALVADGAILVLTVSLQLVVRLAFRRRGDA